MAKRLSRLINTHGTICRLAGDEFVLFMKVKIPFAHVALADEILTTMSERHIILGASAEITASVGVSIIQDKTINFDDARKQGDVAVNKAKQSGKNGVYYYNEALKKDYMKNLMVIKALKNAISEKLFDLHYQPKVDLKTQQTIGVEALLRWTRQNPDKLTPDVFIPVIESTELIHEIGAWVIEEACLACKQWHSQGQRIAVAVNVSALQLAREGFYELVASTLNDCGLEPEYLEIEITEHFLVQEDITIVDQLSRLKKLGVKIAIDDFGTGYSNMGYLTRMSVDTLKLDKSFIRDIDQQNDSLAIVTALSNMTKVLGMSLVAEGVETETERQILESINCPIGQVFLWSKALANKYLMHYLQSENRSRLVEIV